MSEKLKPCPFCGGEARLEYTVEEQYRGKYRKQYYVICTSSYPKECAVKPDTSLYYDKNTAIAAWNRRAK